MICLMYTKADELVALDISGECYTGIYSFFSLTQVVYRYMLSKAACDVSLWLSHNLEQELYNLLLPSVFQKTHA